MEIIRSPFQGVWNIIRFNWHFYAGAVLGIILLLVASYYLPVGIQSWLIYGVVIILCTMSISLGVSYYVYDYSGLYALDWLENFKIAEQQSIVTITAGFDETSRLLQQKFPNSSLIIWDFYNPKQHTEVSIQRARKAYPPFPNTQQIQTTQLPALNNTIAVTFALLTAHEIRDTSERILLFNELRRITLPEGRIVVTEHLRDTANFLAYTLGFFHFHSKKTWIHTFQSSGLAIENTFKITPFITTFILKKHGATP